MLCSAVLCCAVVCYAMIYCYMLLCVVLFCSEMLLCNPVVLKVWPLMQRQLYYLGAFVSHPRATESETLRLEPSNLNFNVLQAILIYALVWQTLVCDRWQVNPTLFYLFISYECNLLQKQKPESLANSGCISKKEFYYSHKTRNTKEGHPDCYPGLKDKV